MDTAVVLHARLDHVSLQWMGPLGVVCIPPTSSGTRRYFMVFPLM